MWPSPKHHLNFAARARRAFTKHYAHEKSSVTAPFRVFTAPSALNSCLRRARQYQLLEQRAAPLLSCLVLHRRCFHTSSPYSAPRSSPPPPLKTTRTPSAADDLISQWSRRRTPTTPSAASTSVSAADTLPTTDAVKGSHKPDRALDNVNVEDLLGYDDDDDTDAKTPHSLAANRRELHKQKAGEGEGRLDNSANAEVQTTRTVLNLEESEDAAAVQAGRRSSAEVGGDDDADVYGMAASAAALERQLLEELLQQATLNTTDSRLADDDDDVVVEDDEEESEKIVVDSRDAQPPQVLSSQTTKSADSQASKIGSEPVFHTANSLTAKESFADPLSRRPVTSTTSPENSDTPGEHLSSERAALPDAGEDTPSELLANNDAENDTADAAEDEEEASLDTVLEEETDRMLQAALANMLKESATNGAAAVAASGGAAGSSSAGSVSRSGGTGGYVFFSKEAVMAAAESLAAEESSLSSSASVSGRGGGAGASDAAAVRLEHNMADAAEFDDDAAREAELESLGINMETSKR